MTLTLMRTERWRVIVWLVLAGLPSIPSAFHGERASVMGLAKNRVPQAPSVSTRNAASRSIHLVIDDALLGSMGDQIPTGFQMVPLSRLEKAPLLAAIAAGDSLVWIGEGQQIPEQLWVGQFRPSQGPLDITTAEGSPVISEDLPFRSTRLVSAYIKPTKEMPHHNVDEEPRAEFLPILEARDRYGRSIGYPGVLMHYYATSLVGRRFAGSECFFFLFDHPSEALSPGGWKQLLKSIRQRFESHLQIVQFDTDYASYILGERVRIRCQVSNLRGKAAAVELRFYAKGPGDSEFWLIASHRRSPDGGDMSEAIASFIPQEKEGLWKIRVEALQDPLHAEELAIEGNPMPVDRREIGFVAGKGKLHSPPMVSLNGPSIQLEGKDGFWAGTHYYPSTSWWEWVWRDFRPLKAAADFAGMRKTGYRIVRIWVDPILDEETLRAMDAAIYLAAQQGIVLDICIFTQWPRQLAYEDSSGRQVTFEFRGSRDFNVYGISFRNLDKQRQYLGTLANRWKGAGNVIFNLSNETFIRDPDNQQLDPEVLGWKGIPGDKSILRDTLLFRRWASEMTKVIREAGTRQPVIPGYLFSTLGGGDSYLGNRDGDITPWHSYLPPAQTASTLQYMDPTCSNRPVILEELGKQGWNSADHYDANAHYALAVGAAAAMSYEWGVSWLARELSFYPAPLREALDSTPDPRWFEPVFGVAKLWSRQGSGLFPAPSGFAYGSIYHGTPFPAESAVNLGRVGRLGARLAKVARPEEIYVVIPTAFNGARTNMEPAQTTFKELWREKIPFGVLQEDCLDRLPSSARVLICPSGVSRESESRLASLRARGVGVVSGEQENWKALVSQNRAPLTPGDGVDVITRRTRQGTLYSLFSQRTRPETVSLRLGRDVEVSLGLERFAMVHHGPNGVDFCEASGEVRVGKVKLCSLGKGRILIFSLDEQDLLHTQRARLLATAPAAIEFEREMERVMVFEEGKLEPVGTVALSEKSRRHLDLDDQLLRYSLEIEFRN